LGVLLSQPIALLFREPELQPIVAWLSLSFIFSALSSTQQAILQRNLEFKKLALRSIIAKISGGGVGIIFALSGAGVWSLVAQTLVYSFVEVVMLWSVSEWRPGVSFSISCMNRLIKFGANMMGVRLIDFFDFRFDDFLVGYFLGATTLGYYTIAFRLLRLLSDFVAGIPSSVIFPTLSRLQHDYNEFKKTFCVIVKYANLLIWPIFLGALTLADDIILSFFGAQWAPSIPVFRLLALGGVLICSLQFNGIAVWAIGRSDYMFRLRLEISIVRIISYLIAVRFGIIYIAIAYLLVNLFVYSPLYIYTSKKFMGLSIAETISLYKSQILATTVMVFLVSVEKFLLSPYIYNVYWCLVSFIMSGFVVYTIAIMVLWPEILGKFTNFANTLRAKAL
jgi:PST family polysaccharide transporter